MKPYCKVLPKYSIHLIRGTYCNSNAYITVYIICVLQYYK